VFLLSCCLKKCKPVVVKNNFPALKTPETENTIFVVFPSQKCAGSSGAFACFLWRSAGRDRGGVAATGRGTRVARSAGHARLLSVRRRAGRRLRAARAARSRPAQPPARRGSHPARHRSPVRQHSQR